VKNTGGGFIADFQVVEWWDSAMGVHGKGPSATKPSPGRASRLPVGSTRVTGSSRSTRHAFAGGAARLDLGQPGAGEQVRGGNPAFDDMAEHDVKNIARPMQFYPHPEAADAQPKACQPRCRFRRIRLPAEPGDPTGEPVASVGIFDGRGLRDEFNLAARRHLHGWMATIKKPAGVAFKAELLPMLTL
jgi:hypothetical protein